MWCYLHLWWYFYNWSTSPILTIRWTAGQHSPWRIPPTKIVFILIIFYRFPLQKGEWTLSEQMRPESGVEIPMTINDNDNDNDNDNVPPTCKRKTQWRERERPSAALVGGAALQRQAIELDLFCVFCLRWFLSFLAWIFLYYLTVSIFARIFLSNDNWYCTDLHSEWLGCT